MCSSLSPPRSEPPAPAAADWSPSSINFHSDMISLSVWVEQQHAFAWKYKLAVCMWGKCSLQVINIDCLKGLQCIWII